MGWLKNLIDRIKGRGNETLTLSEGEQAYSKISNTINQYTLENGDELALKGAKENELRSQREGYLNQLGNSAVELSELGNNLTEEGLIQYAERRGARPIDISSENRIIEKVDVKAAISIGYAMFSKSINQDSIESIGGMANLIEEMSAQAKKTAKDYCMSPEMAGEYLHHPSLIIQNMLQKQREQEDKGEV